MAEDGGPVVAGVPGDLGGGVDLDGHDLADAGALDDDDERADAAVLAAPLLAALDVADDERVADVRARDDVRRADGEAGERVSARVCMCMWGGTHRREGSEWVVL